jgi:hypothetical protein
MVCMHFLLMKNKDSFIPWKKFVTKIVIVNQDMDLKKIM